MNLRLLLLDVSERPEGTDEEVAPSVSFTHHSPNLSTHSKSLDHERWTLQWPR